MPPLAWSTSLNCTKEIQVSNKISEFVPEVALQHTLSQDAICASECAKIPPPPGGMRLKCLSVPFKVSN